MLDLIIQIDCKFIGNISSNKIVILDIPILCKRLTTNSTHTYHVYATYYIPNTLILD